ncbi:T9SS type B sorting domain-containing protein [Oceanihabitans sp. 1_MG-2023]|nr:T9SS type B sorting domain-containing protein [Oceanihabitans sp. 1_MG-2023]
MSYSQDQASNWYFGENAGIQFNTLNGAVTALTDGQLNTKEGCSSISDENGNLLFYTDGTTVYNRMHSVMSNGNNLYGDESSTQSAIVVPKPGDIDIYYIFTVDNAVDGNNDGLNYSTVDMSFDGGLGAVVNKNSSLLSLCSEKITAVLKDCDSESIWVLTLASFNGTTDTYNTYHAFEVTTSGVSNNAVKSTFGVSITDARGYLKTSPDGTKLASANTRSGMYLYDFDTATGIVSNPTTLNINTSNPYAYGVEFSPNNQYLYIHAYNDATGNALSNASSLVQFDLFATDINNSQVLLDDQSLFRGALQLGPNGKIYRTLSNSYTSGIPYLGVINNPNEAGTASNYQHLGVDLGGFNATQGLPPFITSFFNQKIDIIQNGEASTYLPLCDGDNYTLTAENIVGADYIWTQDGVVIAENDYDLEVTQEGTYEVLIELPGGNCETLEGEAVIEYFDNPVVTNTVLIQCDEDGVDDGETIFNLEEANESLTGANPDLEVTYYNSYANAEDELNPIADNIFENTSNPQTIYALVKSIGAGCSTIAEVSLQVSNTQANNASIKSCDDDGVEDGFYTFDLTTAESDILTGLPAGLTIHYYENYNDALLEENEISTIYTNTTAYSQILFARVENANDCYGISEITLTVNTLPELIEDETLYYCLNTYPETISIESGVIGNPNDFTYSWATGETTNQIQINQEGNYTVTVTNVHGCEQSRTITIEPSNIATIDSIEVVDASSNNTITVYASGEGEYEYALFNDAGLYAYYQTSNVFTNVDPGGLYTVSIRDTKNDCGIVEQIVSVIGFPKFFTPNNDGINDYWQVSGVSSVFQPNTKIKIFDRYGKLLKQISPIGPGWDGKFNGQYLPSDDYWFAVTLQDGREYFNHFTLKR